MSLKKLGGETIVYGFSNILGRMLNFVLVTYFITRLMPAEEYGVVGGLMFYTALLIAVLVFRMDTVVFRYASRDEFSAPAVFRKAQRVVTMSVIGVLGLMLLFAQQLADLLEYPDRVVYVQLVIFTVAFDALSAVPLARLRLEQRAWFFVFVNLGNVLVNVVLIFLLLYVWRWNADYVTEHWGFTYDANYQVGYYLLCIALASAFRYVFLLIDGLRRYGKKTGATPSLSTMLAYSLPLTVVGVAGIINFLIAPELIKFWHGGSVTENLRYAGYFNAATKLAVFLNLFITAYNYAAEPFFFRQAGNKVESANRQIYADAARAYAIVATLASAGILLFLPWLELFIDEEERAGLYVLPMLLAANFFFGLYSNLSVAYKLTDKTLYGGAMAAVGSLIVIGGGIFFVPEYGITAMAWAMLTCFIVMCFLAWLVSRKFFPVNYPWGRIAIYALLACTAVYCASWLPADVGDVAQDTMGGRIAIFMALLVAFGLLERGWIKRTFLEN
jgi:O-antigen/teichoic acid export membrane protein